jgi:hypothetical protein
MIKTEVSKGGHTPVFADEGVVIKVKKTTKSLLFTFRNKYILPIYTVKVKFTLEQATKAQWGSRGIALLFL